MISKNKGKSQETKNKLRKLKRRYLNQNLLLKIIYQNQNIYLFMYIIHLIYYLKIKAKIF